MAKRPIKQGETVPRIAAEEGFDRWEDVWEAPDNAELKKQYDPCVLPAGEEIFVPEPKPEKFKLETGKRHRIVVRRPKLSLAVVAQKYSGKPLSTGKGTLICDGKEIPVTLDGTGKFSERIPVTTKLAELVLPDPAGGEDVRLALQVGHLDPIDSVSGWRGRLANLGYPVEFDDGRADDDETCLRLAIEEFQCENGIKVTGERDSATRAKLLEIHGS